MSTLMTCDFCDNSFTERFEGNKQQLHDIRLTISHKSCTTKDICAECVEKTKWKGIVASPRSTPAEDLMEILREMVDEAMEP